MLTMEFTSTYGERRWQVRFLSTGDRYGLDGCLEVARPMVEFHDCAKFSEGRFAARYYLETLLKRQPAGLSLRMDVEPWKLSAVDMAHVMSWIVDVVCDLL
jgi:hypothetical protein